MPEYDGDVLPMTDDVTPETIRGWLEWIAIVKDEDCRYDHHDYCQAHNLDERPCPVGEIKAYLAGTGGMRCLI